MAWIFLLVIVLYSAVAYLLERSGKVSTEKLQIGGLAAGFAYWIVVSLLPR